MSSINDRSVRIENIPAWYDAERVKDDFLWNTISEPATVKICGQPSSNERTWGVVTFGVSNEARYFVEEMEKHHNHLVWKDTGEHAWVQVDGFLLEMPRADGVGKVGLVVNGGGLSVVGGDGW